MLGNERTGRMKLNEGRHMLNKVPEVTLVLWTIKIMSTTVGETGADYLAVHVGLGTAVTGLLMAGLLAVALVCQLSMNRYVPWIYWLTVVLVSIVGTQITDALTDKLEVSLYVSTAVFAMALAAIFAVWYAVERTLSIHTIVTTRRELFYWAAILFTFALGTAAGDLATEALGLGFNVGVFAFAGLIAAIAAAYALGANAVLTFWLAYILSLDIDVGFTTAETIAVEGAAFFLESAVRNLIENAVKFTPAGGKVDIGIYREGDTAVVQIEDTGPGIPPSDIDRVFEPFFRSRQSGGEGSGLGLSIVKRIVERFRGSIQIENIAEANRSGLRAILRLPATDKPPS